MITPVIIFFRETDDLMLETLDLKILRRWFQGKVPDFLNWDNLQNRTILAR